MARYQSNVAPEAPVTASSATAPEGSGDHPAGNKPILGAIIIGVGVLFVVASLFFFLRRVVFPYFRHRKLRKGAVNWVKLNIACNRGVGKGLCPRGVIIGSLKAEKLPLRKYKLEELAKATNNFSDECLLGSGACGRVYKGTFEAEGGLVLAIKKAHANSYQSLEEFRNEVRLLSKVKHRNLVGLVGFCEQPGAKGAKVLVYEYVPNGSLLEYIMGRCGRCLTWRQRVNIAIGAAKGIAHLHDGVRPSIIHRDIKPSNILVGHGFEAKVSDFGLVKLGPIGDQSHVSSQIKGTPGYLDPAYCSSFHLSPLSDVFSFGVILLQLVAARPAVDAVRNREKSHIIEWARPSLERGNVVDILDANLLTEPCNMKVMLKMGELGLRCAVRNPKDRPTMTQVWQELEESLYAVDGFVHRPPARGARSSFREELRSMDRGSSRLKDFDYSDSFVSVDGVGYQRFRVEMDSISFQSASLRCLEASSIGIDIDSSLCTVGEETSNGEG